ncbi:hypothetical protein CYY_000680 [Polysphondylium violaceum]|uniref:Oxysterol binding family protein n=1 Tax=Polysphondylium violaceum TaxID=133409 RepID=A0A8J4Q4C5_9MYCE|nr:hypothetical protein CYY_000680 [Polysphondylium violaceum]
MFFKKLVGKEPKSSRGSSSSTPPISSPSMSPVGSPIQKSKYDNIETTQEELDNIDFGKDTDSTVPPEDKKNLWKKVKGLVGKDPMSLVSLPVYFFEPITVLQSQCEPLRFVELIEKACTLNDPIERLIYITAFNVAVFSSYIRTAKPFNPLLGETFEYIPKDGSYKIFGEQVSHHPPIGVVYTTAGEFSLQQESWITTKFWGNSLDVFSHGQNHLKLHKSGDHYTWRVPSSICHNIILGRMWIEHHGDLTIVNEATGDKAVINFQKAGWFEGGQKKISGSIVDGQGRMRCQVSGKWNQHVKIRQLDQNGIKSKEFIVWEAKPEPKEVLNKWNHGPFIQSLNEMTPEHESILPPTDSRVRMDRRYLEREDNKMANKEKNRIEENEREKRKEREAKGIEWRPNYFTKRADKQFGYRWDFTGDYWSEREKRIETVVSKKEAQRQPFNIRAIPTYKEDPPIISTHRNTISKQDSKNQQHQVSREGSLEDKMTNTSISTDNQGHIVTTTRTTTTTVLQDSHDAKLEGFEDNGDHHVIRFSSPAQGQSSR